MAGRRLGRGHPPPDLRGGRRHAGALDGPGFASGWAGQMSALALTARQSVHGPMAVSIIYVRHSYKEASAADVSDEMQEAACRALLPAGTSIRVISDSGGHNSGFIADRDGYQALLAALAAGDTTGIWEKVTWAAAATAGAQDLPLATETL